MATFNKPKHVTYWLRCLKTYLPWQYTSMDSNRLMLAYFIVAALDLLGALDDACTEEERTYYVDWIYSLQLDTGGFRGFPGTDFGEAATATNKAWDPANIPATYFAVATLLILRDDLKRVKRRECLEWLVRMQRHDGSFGQTLGPEGTIEGGFDTRFAYTAMGIRWILGGDISAKSGEVCDVDCEALVQGIKKLQTYDGGLADLPNHEPHGGFVYCALSALSLVNKLDDGIGDPSALLHWLMSRQTQMFDQDDSSSEEEDPSEADEGAAIGFNGRCNKVADSCYTWWVCASLKTLGHLDLIDKASAIQYLLDQSQHFIGGFAKLPGNPPDLYHSYLGLATLGLLGHPDVKSIHPTACISQSAVDYLEQKIRPNFESTS